MGCEMSGSKELRGTLVSVVYLVYDEQQRYNPAISGYEYHSVQAERTEVFFFPDDDTTNISYRFLVKFLKDLKGYQLECNPPPDMMIELPLDCLLYKNQRGNWTERYISRNSLLRFMVEANHLKTEGEQ